jgi:alpha-galactosidase
MKRKFVFILIAGLAVSVAASAAVFDPVAAHDKDGLARFAAQRVDRPDGPPFSFVYSGQPSASFLAEWPSKTDKKADGDRTTRTTVYTDPATKLRVTVVYTMYKDFPAVEWVVRFKNTGATDTPIIENVLASAVRFNDWPEGLSTLYRARGSDATRDDFGPIVDPLQSKAEISFGPPAGRSSEGSALPFFNIAGPDRGIMVGIGWSGSWRAVVRRTGGRSLGLDAGMPKTRFRLHPGEEVRIPMISLLFWKGAERFDGHNLFRRFVLAHHAPRPNGKLLEPPLSHTIGSGGPVPCNEFTCATENFALSMIERLSQFGIEPDAYWIDAGWYESRHKSWWGGVGTWSPDKKRFPRGIKPISDLAKSKGKKFVLWFEPERVFEGTQIDREHKEWLTFLPNEPSRLFDLGNPEAMKWLTGLIADRLIAEGVSIYRQDFNMDPAPYWRLMDKPDRVGIAEMKHIEGLYAFWDGLLARVPGLLIDNCASGGRRIDLETIGRSIPLWRTDYQYFEPNGSQCHTYGLQLYLPFSGTGNGDPQKYAFRSVISGAAAIWWDINGAYNRAQFLPSQAIEAIADFHALAPYFFGDYYPLSEYSTSDEAWAAFQWSRPEERDGIVLAFRRPRSVEPAMSLALHGLDPAADYEVNYEDYGIVVVKSGQELMAGLAVRIPEPTASLLIKYRRVR